MQYLTQLSHLTGPSLNPNRTNFPPSCFCSPLTSGRGMLDSSNPTALQGAHCSVPDRGQQPHRILQMMRARCLPGCWLSAWTVHTVSHSSFYLASSGLPRDCCSLLWLPSEHNSFSLGQFQGTAVTPPLCSKLCSL